MYPLKVSYIYERDTRTDLGITNWLLIGRDVQE